MNHWQLNDNIAKWSNDTLSLSLDRTNPDAGLSLRTPGFGTEPVAKLFGVCLPSGEKPALSPAQQMGSGSTLRLTFAETQSFPVETCIAWHVLEIQPDILGIDVVVSIGTQKLDAHPQLELCSRIKTPDSPSREPGTEWANSSVDTSTGTGAGDPTTYDLFRLPDGDLTYVEMAHPSDFHSYGVSQDCETGYAVLRHSLLSHSLEKGVILRARLRGLLLPRDDDQASAAACFAQFLAAAPPLGH